MVLRTQNIQEDFSIHSLALEELESWLDFVASVFAPKTTRTYFSNHWHKDPFRNNKSIFVIKHPEDASKFIATIRIFERQMYFQGKKLKYGGIGEVSTHVDFRGKKLATNILKETIKYMKENNFAISALHTGPQAPLYQHNGWDHIPMLFTVIDATALLRSSSQLPMEQVFGKVETPDFNDTLLLEQMKEQYSYLNEHHLMSGSLVRDSLDYWRNWVATEVYSHSCKPLMLITNERKLRAYLVASVVPKQLNENEVYLAITIKEFVPSKEENQADNLQLFVCLLMQHVQNTLNSLEVESSQQLGISSETILRLKQQGNPLHLRIRMNKPIAHLILKVTKAFKMETPSQSFSVNKIEEESEDGYMYQVIDHELSFAQFKQEMMKNHMFFKTDGY